uniref:phosphoenolpyruvate carboxykinase (ATP) n=1 Tax=Bacillus altitudinis TaxID=293387 RepID=UPI0011A2014C
IADHHHTSSNTRLFNIQTASYPKSLNLTQQKQPQIYKPITFPSLLQNLLLHQQTPQPHYHDTFFTQNTPPPYPIEIIDNILKPTIPPHPSAILFLAA